MMSNWQERVEKYSEKENSYYCKKCKVRHHQGRRLGIIHWSFRSQIKQFQTLGLQSFPKEINKDLLWENKPMQK